ncbi:tRNA adenosine(34) deaminase TadA [Streptomyces sp. RB6PN25]|uniref:tRNA-specific adenosine deaminase n=1 Tax=Streptomyces humicola TaxID=2953240 RepID=A0ABT1Q3F9_9ACTN|nr:tRNA adenosine(34) deaminase TadA [Streptomyces humicola]MCQ4084462.1 tRNA adenosine(34) deaminase TadA [Streptomyces humicola]
MPDGDPVRDPWVAPIRLALEQAALAPRSGDVPVGAVVLAPDGSVIGRGHNEREAVGDPTAHAEVLAIREAAGAVGSWRLTGCTLVVTLEPCTMCAGAIVLSRLERVVYGAVDEKAGAVGSLWDVVRDRRLNHRPEVIAGVLPDECARLLTDFFRGPSRPAQSAGPSKPSGPSGPSGPGADFGAPPDVR